MIDPDLRSIRDYPENCRAATLNLSITDGFLSASRRGRSASCHRLVEQHDIAITKSARLGELHRQLLFDTFEQRPALADDERVKHGLGFVNQSGIRPLCDDTPASHDHPVRTRLLL